MAADNEVTPDVAMTPQEVAAPSLAALLADLVRERSRSQAKLTPLDRLEVEGTIIEPAKQEGLLADILGDEQCADVKLMRTSEGTAYLYSDSHMTESYARILLRVEEDDPYRLIASTVREESEIYPRPTPVDTFLAPAFGLDATLLPSLVDEMLQLQQYRDVKLIVAATGRPYLYSERYLDGEWARSLVDWEEVGKRNNP